MKIKQISVFLENKKGRLAQLTKILKENNIDISAISVADNKFWNIRMIVSRYSDAMRVIKDAGYTVNTTDVLAVEVADCLVDCIKSWKSSVKTILALSICIRLFVGHRNEP